MRKFLSVALGAAALLAAMPALAQEQRFGKQLDVAFAADRLFGITFTHESREDQCRGPRGVIEDCDFDTTGFGIGWRGQYAPSPFDVPRFAFDIFVIDSLSIGGALGYVQYSRDEDPSDNEDIEYTDFIFSPRIGYVIMFTDRFGFWPRGGLTYHSSSADPDGPGEDKWDGFAFTAEAMFVWTPVEHFGFGFGPTFDIDITGKDRPDPGDNYDRRYRSIALVNVSVFGWI